MGEASGLFTWSGRKRQPLAAVLTMPLAEPDAMGKVLSVLCPTIRVNGRHLYAPTHYTAALPAK